MNAKIQLEFSRWIFRNLAAYEAYIALDYMPDGMIHFHDCYMKITNTEWQKVSPMKYLLIALIQFLSSQSANLTLSPDCTKRRWLAPRWAAMNVVKKVALLMALSWLSKFAAASPEADFWRWFQKNEVRLFAVDVRSAQCLMS